MSGVAAGIMAAAAVAGAAISYKNGQAQQAAAGKAQKQQKSAAEALYNQQDQANNKANAHGPNTDAMFAANQQAGQAGPSGTMLTGPSGVDPNSLSLGQNTLIGGAGAGASSGIAS